MTCRKNRAGVAMEVMRAARHYAPSVGTNPFGREHPFGRDVFQHDERDGRGPWLSRTRRPISGIPTADASIGRSQGGGVRITRVQAVHCDAGWRPWTFVKVDTDVGLVGWGECSDSRNPYGGAGSVGD